MGRSGAQQGATSFPCSVTPSAAGSRWNSTSSRSELWAIALNHRSCHAVGQNRLRHRGASRTFRQPRRQKSRPRRDRTRPANSGDLLEKREMGVQCCRTAAWPGHPDWPWNEAICPRPAPKTSHRSPRCRRRVSQLLGGHRLVRLWTAKPRPGRSQAIPRACVVSALIAQMCYSSGESVPGRSVAVPGCGEDFNFWQGLSLAPIQKFREVPEIQIIPPIRPTDLVTKPTIPTDLNSSVFPPDYPPFSEV